jgi:SAM-dependent methyltransferase
MTTGTAPNASPSPDQARIWAYFQGQGNSYFAQAWPRQNALVRAIARLAGAKPHVLNIGVGDGFLEQRMHERGWIVSSLDPDRDAVSRLAANGIDARSGNIEQMPFDARSFDFVVASEVLEHLTTAQLTAGLAEINRLLKPGGWFIGTVPFAEDLASGATVCQQCGATQHRWGHQQSFDLDRMSGLLSAAFPGGKVSLRRTAFPDWSRSVTGLAKSALRVLLAKRGVAIAQPSLFFRVNTAG